MILSVLFDGVRREYPVDAPEFTLTCDVLTVGAGAAGCYAADAAAREGADVILLEYGQNIGGMPVGGYVTGYYFGAPGGAYEADDAAREADDLFFSPYCAEARQVRLAERLKRSGVRLFAGVSPLGVYLEGNEVVGLLILDGGREVSVGAHITVDATSDGHLVRMLPAAISYGRPEDGATVPFSVRTQYLEGEKYYSDNGDAGIVDQYDPEALSRAIVEAHAAAGRHITEEKKFLGVAIRTGLREGLHFEGERTLTCRDVLMGVTPERVLFYAYSDLDRHGYDRAIDDELFQSFWVVAGLATLTVRIPVPMGAIVPRGIRGLVTAGRCLSADTYVSSAVRMNRDMFRMGECIGYAAAAAVREGVDLLDIDYPAFRRRAEASGAFSGYPDRHFGFDETKAAHLHSCRVAGRTPDPRYLALAPGEKVYTPVDFSAVDVLAALRTDAPGVGLFAAYLGYGPGADCLAEEMANADDTLYRYNCAIALGLLGDGRATPALAEIVRERDCFFFKGGRRSNQFRTAVAVCLLGRVGGESEVPLLEALLREEEYDRPMYHTLAPDYFYYPRDDRAFVYFDVTTHAASALCRLYRRLGLPMVRLRALAERFFDGKFRERVTDSTPGSPTTEETERLIGILLRRMEE